MVFIGIDPGKSGALAIIDGTVRVSVFNPSEYVEILTRFVMSLMKKAF